jgi:hypothetical protein
MAEAPPEIMQSSNSSFPSLLRAVEILLEASNPSGPGTGWLARSSLMRASKLGTAWLVGTTEMPSIGHPRSV